MSSGYRVRTPFSQDLLRKRAWWLILSSIYLGIDTSDSLAEVDVSSFGITSPDVFIEAMSRSLPAADEANFEVLVHSLDAVLNLGFFDPGFWRRLISHESFFNMLRALLLSEQKSTRCLVVRKVREIVAREASTKPMASEQMSQSLWALVSQLIEEATHQPERCHELFDLSYYILRDARNRWRQGIDFAALAATMSNLLLSHTSSEVSISKLWTAAVQRLRD